jgi:tripartite-type tricarboxylate transporter receptor subunit TctC
VTFPKSILALLFIALSAHAQPWPAKPVKLIVPGPAGSAPDIVARLLGERLTPIWGQQLVVDNRVGAAGNIGTAAAATAPADGYNLLFGLSAALAINQHTFKSLPFSPETDFTPIVSLGISPMMIAVHNDLPVKSLGELLALARAQPGKVNFGTSSSKNVAHLTGEMLASMAGVKLVHVPYRTNAQAAAETTSGLTQIYVDGIPPMLAHLKAGRLRVIAVSSQKRLPNFPEIAAVAESVPGFSFNGWFCLMAPTGTSNEIVARVNQDVNQVLKMPDIAARLLGFGIYDPGGTPEELAQFIRAERQNFARAVKTAGIEPE